MLLWSFRAHKVASMYLRTKEMESQFPILCPKSRFASRVLKDRWEVQKSQAANWETSRQNCSRIPTSERKVV